MVTIYNEGQDEVLNEDLLCISTTILVDLLHKQTPETILETIKSYGYTVRKVYTLRKEYTNGNEYTNGKEYTNDVTPERVKYDITYNTSCIRVYGTDGEILVLHKDTISYYGVRKLLPYLIAFKIWSESETTPSETPSEHVDHVDKLKTTFLASISHEIRTPLNGILGISQLMNAMEDVSAKQKEYIHIIQKCSSQLLELINDILDFSKLQANCIQLSKDSFHIKQVIQDAIDIVHYKQEEQNKSVSIHVDIDHSVPIKILADSRRIKQIIINLLSNALKFTKQGHIYIRLRSQLFHECINEIDEIIYHRLFFEIQDTGSGISETEQAKIFDTFHKARNYNQNDEQYKGAGLGLSIVHHLIELMNGTISVQSDGFTGTTFSFDIVVEDDTTADQLYEMYKDIFTEKHILVVEKNIQDKLKLYETLKQWKSHVYLLSSIEECVSMYTHHESMDAIILHHDIVRHQMFNNPVIESTLESIAKKIPILCMIEQDGDIPQESYFTSYLKKPISKSHLFNILSKVLRKNFIIHSPRHSIERKLDKSTTRIIIAEDDHYNQFLLREFLLTYGYHKHQIDIVSNGQECVHAVQTGTYDICFMDIKMPVLDGLEATKCIRKTNSHIIIIAVSASILEKEHNTCFESGMNYFVEKPVNRKKLFELIDTFHD